MSIECISDKDFLHFMKNTNFFFDFKNFYHNLFQHAIIYGCSQIHKIEIIRFLIKNYYLINNSTFTIEKHIHHINSNNRSDFYQLTINKSPIHWEIDFNYTGSNSNSITNKNNNDYFVLQYLMEYLFKNVNINSNISKIIVFNNLHKLQFHYQKMLYQSMEKQYNNIKFIFITDYINRIESTLISRCIQIRIPMFYYLINPLKPYIIGNRDSKYLICFYLIFNKKNQKIFSCIIHKDSNYYLYDNHCITEILLQKHFDNDILINNTPLYYFDKFINDIYDFVFTTIKVKNSRSKNIQCIEKYNRCIQTMNNYFIDCHHINSFFKNWILSFSLCDYSKNLNINHYQYIVHTISELEYNSLYSDYNNYILENFLSKILYFLIQLNRTTTL